MWMQMNDMRKHLLSLFLLTPFLLLAQNRLNIEIDLDTIKRKVEFNAFGINVERMHYRNLDGQGKIPQPILDDMLDAEDIIYRWPGGATANFYHFFEGSLKGYGLLREEIEAIDHPMSCNLPAGNPNCMSFEETTPTNYIYNLLDYADKYYEKFNKRKQVLYLPNIFTFYIHNKSDIHKLNSYTSYEEITEAWSNGELEDGFYKRLKDVFDVYDILINHPTIEVVGVELGNEFYFHDKATGAKYNEVNNGLAWLLNQAKYRATVKEHMSYYKSLVKFYTTALPKRGVAVPAGVPVAIIANNGQQANMHLLWNEGIRDSILPLVDGVIHHFYFKRNDGPRIDPKTAEDPGNADNLLKVKTLADNFIHVRVPNVDDQYEKFFKLSELGKRMWITEFNTDNGYFDGYFAEWQNSFFHSYFQFEVFISFIDNVHDNNVVQFAFPHVWISHETDYNYGAYAAKTELNGNFKKIKRTTYSTYSILGSLAKKEIRKVNTSWLNTEGLERHDLYVKTYFEPKDDPASQEIGNIIVVFSNKSGQPLHFKPWEDIVLADTTERYQLQNAFAEYLNAPHIYSSNGYTFHDTSGEDAGEVINVIKEYDIDVTSDYILDGYSLGYISIPVKDVTKVVTGIRHNKKDVVFNVYPNPANQTLTISANQPELIKNRKNYFVVDASGRQVQVPMTWINESTLQLNIQSLPSGMYNFIMENDPTVHTASFIKQ